jgi:hypothetical protein
LIERQFILSCITTFEVQDVVLLRLWMTKTKSDLEIPTYNHPNCVKIGSATQIDRRTVPIAPGVTLSNDVPFYFTPFSLMMFNIKTGYGEINKRDKKNIVIVVSSIHKLHALGFSFVFTNQHAYSYL